MRAARLCFLFGLQSIISLTPCQRELATMRYERAISEQFPPLQNGEPSVRPRGAEKNLFCLCSNSNDYSPIWMICAIAVYTHEHAVIINRRLERNVETLQPFSLLLGFPYREQPPIVYVHSECIPSVYAEIQVFGANNFLLPTSMQFWPWIGPEPPILPTDWPPYRGPPVPPERSTDEEFPRSRSAPNMRLRSAPDIQRVNSSPPTYHFPTKYMSLQMCTGGSDETVCPITIQPFQPKQIVYVLKSEEDKLQSGSPVSCISAEGLVKLKNADKSIREGGFIDPLKRNDRILTLDDYEPYFVYDENACSAEELMTLKMQELDMNLPQIHSMSSGAGPSHVIIPTPETTEESTQSSHLSSSQGSRDNISEVRQSKSVGIASILSFQIVLILSLSCMFICLHIKRNSEQRPDVLVSLL